MTEIKGQYLYNLKTGQTIGRNKDDVKTSEDKNQYSVNGVKHNWETYQLLSDISNVIDYDYGTVEDLRLSQIVQLFAQGNMTVDELQIGLKSKKIADINITENGGITTVTFTYEDKKYTLKCSTDAAQSQIDDINDAATDNITIEGGTTTPATPDSRALTQEEIEARKASSRYYSYTGEKKNISIDNVAGIIYPDNDGVDEVYGASLPSQYPEPSAWDIEKKDVYDLEWDWAASSSYWADIAVQICDKLGIEYDGRKAAIYALFDLTDEQIQYVNSHPGEFYGMKCQEHSNGSNGIYFGAYYDLYCYSKIGVSAEETYWSQVDKFSKTLQEYQGVNLMLSPECNGDTVSFTDDSIETIKEMLMKGRGCDDKYHHYDLYNNKNEYRFVQMLGLTQNDSEEEIRKKVEDFCYKIGSTDGRTILIEDYYNALAEAQIGSTKGNENKLLTYDDISRNINNALYLKIDECERLGIDISDLGLTKPSSYIKSNVSEALDVAGLMNNGVNDERYSNKYYNDDVTVPEDPWIDVPENYVSADGDTSGVGYYVYKLKEKYPEIYEKFKDIFPEYGNGHGKSRDISICITSTCFTDNQDFRKLLMYAAGVSQNDIDNIYGNNSVASSINEKVATALGGIVDGPYVASDIEFDVIDLMNYLLGKNDTGTNYFYASGIVSQTTTSETTDTKDVVEDELDKKVREISRFDGNIEDLDEAGQTYIKNLRAMLEQGTVETDGSISVVRDDDLNKVASKEGEFEKSELSQEIRSYIKELIDPIYTKYFGKLNSDSYSPYLKLDYDITEQNDYRGPHLYSWKKEEYKQDYINEVEAAIQKALEKYSDDLTSITFDGWYINFTTKDDSTFAGPTIFAGDTSDNGKLGRYGFVEDTPPVIDTPRIYTSAPSLIEKNYPEKAPAYHDIYGDEDKEVDLYKTPWDGVLVDLEGYVYLYDVEKERYIKCTHNVDSGALAKGDTNALNKFLDDACFNPEKSGDYDIARLVLCNIYGYNLTMASNIFEKDGKYYQFDTRKSTSNTDFDVTSPENFISMLTEIEFVGVSTPATQNDTHVTQQAPKAVVQPEAVEPPLASTPETQDEVMEQPSTPITEEREVNTNEDVIVKSEDVLSEMQAAADKLSLTAAKTTGTYYQFSAQGSYLYVWNPQTKKFKAFSINTRNADGSINQEFTQAGKAVNRTEANIYYEALLEAYKNGYDFTANYPWVCQKDGVYYEYDKEAGCFKKRAK